MNRAQRIFERKDLVVEPFPVDFQSHSAWAGPIWRNPTWWIPTASALDARSRALRELIGRIFYRVW